ncbi:helix-turn-helix transcriptional regulator [Shimia sp. MMG029]|uniref:helix-turn-helix transcriptional regulator n=1 Tax=Shimia sp. MMG029 TaxID=3021978 RepID=UPI0022FDB586|nr:AraC family transcriptional regulator [Shimia sp. MMG029]MDA5558710.1 AraC family transcriptional regulator ligand-binding domain-containing protein [Shimia sp. MMG029]
MADIDPADVIPNHWVRSILDLPHLQDYRQDALAAARLREDHLTESGEPIPRGSEAAILKILAERLGTPWAGAELGMAIDPRNTSLLTYILFNSNTLLQAIHHVQHFTPVTRPKARIELRQTTDHIDLIIDGVGATLLLETHLVEFALAAMLGAFRAATHKADLVTKIGLANPRRSGQAELSKIYACPVTLGAKENYIRFPSSVLETPIRGADAQLLRHLTSYGEVLLSQNVEAPPTLTELIERHLLHGMAVERPKLSDLARKLGMSERTLNRRLQTEGQSFRNLVSETQIKLARAFLSDPNLSLAEIAHMSGFSDQSSFTQSYRRRTGNTPKQDRVLLIKSKDLR